MRPDETEGFCPGLQVEWTLVDVKISSSEARVRVESFKKIPKPDPLGRAGAEVMAEPTVFRTLASAVLTFRGVETFRISDDSAHQGVGESAKFKGRFFRRYDASSLLEEQQKRWPEGDSMASRYKHYQLILSNEVIDVVCTDIPEICFVNFPDT